MTNKLLEIHNKPLRLDEVNKKYLVPISSSLFTTYVQRINKMPFLTKEEEFLLAKSYLEKKDLNAAHKLVTSHLRLVVKIALTYKNYLLSILDLVSEGNIGLLHAVKKYNPDLGYRFATYAMWWIKAAIQEYILKSWSIVKIGTTAEQKKLFFNLKKTKNHIAYLNDNRINHEDYEKIAKNLGIPLDKVLEMNNRLSNYDISLNKPITSREGAKELIEFLPSQENTIDYDIEYKQEYANRKFLLTEAIKTLKERELYIFKSRKMCDKAITLEKLSKKFNISKERVRQIENKAFDKIKQYIARNSSEMLAAQVNNGSVN